MSLALLLLAAALDPAASATASVAPPKTVQAEDADRVVCRRERVIGSKVASRRICMTVRERDRAAQTIQQDMGELIKRNTGGATPQ